MNKKLILFSTLVLLFHQVFATGQELKKPPSVLIIGGGPAGLATAIEARRSGCPVTIVEKRNAYSRPQDLFLFDDSLQLLKKWQVAPPELQVADLGDGTLIGTIAINHLEEQLEKRAKELGVKKIKGKFHGLQGTQTALITIPKSGELALRYDILVGADGSHSSVREALAIEKTCLGKGFGAFAIMKDAPSTKIDISPPIKQDKGFLRRFKIPSANIVFIHSPLEASKTKLQQALKTQGWSAEAKTVKEDKAFTRTDIPILLQQANTFSNEKKSAILVGDAAATASFFQGMGANTALKAAALAGDFFKQMQKDPRLAFDTFNREMKKTTDALIEDSAFLFEPEQFHLQKVQKTAS